MCFINEQGGNERGGWKKSEKTVNEDPCLLGS